MISFQFAHVVECKVSGLALLAVVFPSSLFLSSSNCIVIITVRVLRRRVTSKCSIFRSCCTFVLHPDWWKERNVYTLTDRDASLSLWTTFTHESGGCCTFTQPTFCSELILVAGMIAMIYVFVLSHPSSAWLENDNCLDLKPRWQRRCK